jgi:hypothetical protein
MDVGEVHVGECIGERVRNAAGEERRDKERKRAGNAAMGSCKQRNAMREQLSVGAKRGMAKGAIRPLATLFGQPLAKSRVQERKKELEQLGCQKRTVRPLAIPFSDNSSELADRRKTHQSRSNAKESRPLERNGRHLPPVGGLPVGAHGRQRSDSRGAYSRKGFSRRRFPRLCQRAEDRSTVPAHSNLKDYWNPAWLQVSTQANLR